MLTLCVNILESHLSMASLFSAIEDTLESKSGELCASDFTSSKGTSFAGFGFANHCPFFDATDVEEDSRLVKLWSYFNKDTLEISQLLCGETVDSVVTKLVRTITVYNDLSEISEIISGVSATGKNLTVRDHHLHELKSMFKTILQTSSKETLENLDCGFGIVTPKSVPGGYFFSHFDGGKKQLRGIIEGKKSSQTPVEGLRRGAAEASNIAASQLSYGINANDIVVPVIGSNGYLIQFGAVIVLEPSFPVFLMISHVLDLTNITARIEAARILCCIKIMISAPLRCDGPNMIIDKMRLSQKKYHNKSLNHFFPCTGNIQTSLFYFFLVMQRLHSNINCRNLVVFPICVREYNDDISECYIVFPKLDSNYQIGLPNEDVLRESFIDKFKDAIHKFHEAGVVHMDLYLSNIMWCKIGCAEVKLKFIDWDSSLFIDDIMPTRTLHQLPLHREELKAKAIEEDGYVALNERDRRKYYDLSLLRVFQKYKDTNEKLQIRTKVELDKACIEAQYLYIQDR